MGNKKEDFYIGLRFPNEDLDDLRKHYKFVGFPSADDIYFKNLGFNKQMNTLMCTRDRKAQLPGKALHTLARSWFKEISNAKEQKIDDKDVAKKYLREFVEQGKAVKVLARRSKKLKQVPSTSGPGGERKSELNVQKQGPSTSAPPRGRKSMLKMQKRVPSTSAPRIRRKSKAEMPQMQEIPEMQAFNKLFEAIELDQAER